MAMLNIPSSVDDPSYRYKMPRIISQKECRGKGSKTGIMNMGDVARALKRDPVYLTKFFGYELCAASSYTNKESEGERVVINGHHDTPVFQTLVDKFIEKYVLCVRCNLPEIDIVVKKGLIGATCKACGWNGELDNGHKLATYISKNHPVEEKKPKEKKEKKQKKDIKEKKEKKDIVGASASTGPASKDSEKISDAEEEDLKYDGEDTAGLVRDLAALIQANPRITTGELFTEVRAQQATKGFDHKLRMYIVVSALFPEGSLKADSIAPKTKYLKKFIQNAKMPFVDWIWGFEAYLAMNPTATKAWPMAMKALYDEDLAEEEHILQYYRADNENPGFEISKKALDPFLKWLQIASDSEEDKDDSDEDSD